MSETRQQRRARIRKWRAEMHQLHKEASGVLSVEVYPCGRAAEIMERAAAGDLGCIRAGGIMFQVMQQIVKLQVAGDPALCGSCDRRLLDVILNPDPTSVFHIVAAYPDGVDKPTQAVTLCICSTCAPTAADINGKALEALRRIWPELRAIDIANQAGHA